MDLWAIMGLVTVDMSLAIPPIHRSLRSFSLRPISVLCPISSISSFILRPISVLRSISVCDSLSPSVRACLFVYGDNHKVQCDQWMDNEDTMDLNDTDYMSGDELMDQYSDGDGDEDEVVAVEDTLMSTAENHIKRGRGGKRRHSKCWKHFDIVGEKYPDGSNDVQWFMDLEKNGGEDKEVASTDHLCVLNYGVMNS
ncbi:hypothetical protein F2Q70_00009336 [Brassica cretica]|uniref:Uncharacterized protein n=1 Tax=Brassica cretica TaxID=69181 RepID=A0A8S9M6Y3_BRACR|nr:hypothetical protein F2Q70_00009336 [Brassica cretica]